jgi:hypothetical protein
VFPLNLHQHQRCRFSGIGHGQAFRALPRLSGIEWNGQLIAGIPDSNFVTVIGPVSGFYQVGRYMPGGCLLLALEPVGVA